MKILIVGMNPSNKPTLKNKNNSTFRKLEEWMTSIGVNYFSFVNTFDEAGAPSLSKVDYSRLEKLSSEYEKILALGSFVSSALDKINVQHFALPHPSPRNRKLNDKQYEKDMLLNLEVYVK